MRIRLVWALVASLGLLGPAVAQVGAPVTPYAAPRNALDNESSTIATTNTFQAVFPSNLNRQGCTIQNNGTNSMWVFFGATASATKGTSVVLAAGQAAYCGSGLLTYQGVVAITGTMGDAFYAAGQ